MPSHSSISSSRQLPAALLVAFLATLALEISLSFYMPPRYFSHEVDVILGLVENPDSPVRKAWNEGGEVLILGDSVGRLLVRYFALDSRQVVKLTSNGVVETAGQYFIFKRYLDRLKSGELPKAVVYFAALHPGSYKLEGNFVENYIQRCFIEWYEIADLFLEKKDLVFSLKMLAFKLLPSYRYRTHIQKMFDGLIEVQSFTISSAPGADNQGEKVSRQEGEEAADLDKNELKFLKTYIEKLVTLAEKNGMSVFFVQAPISDAVYKRNRKKTDTTIQYLRNLEKKFSSFQFVSPSDFVLNRDYFVKEPNSSDKGRGKVCG